MKRLDMCRLAASMFYVNIYHVAVRPFDRTNKLYDKHIYAQFQMDAKPVTVFNVISAPLFWIFRRLEESIAGVTVLESIKLSVLKCHKNNVISTQGAQLLRRIRVSVIMCVRCDSFYVVLMLSMKLTDCSLYSWMGLQFLEGSSLRRRCSSCVRICLSNVLAMHRASLLKLALRADGLGQALIFLAAASPFFF